MAVYGYGRVSTTAQSTEGVSLEVQQREITGYAAMRGWTTPTIYVEAGISGSVPLAERPEGGKMWRALVEGDIIIASRLDRMFRSAVDALQTVERLKKIGVSLILIDLGGDISGNGLSKLFLTVAAAFAEAERDRIRERVATVKRDQRAQGRYLGGKVPFGYQVSESGDLVKTAAQHPMIEYAIGLKMQGKTIREIQAALAEKGARLSVGGVHKLLKRETA